jgi:hypothetical protein
MIRFLTGAAVSVGLFISAGAVSANMLFTVTEGDGNNRFQIAGSTKTNDASPNAAGAIDLNNLASNTSFGAGDVIGVYGRIVSSQDKFQYAFDFTGGFNVTFDLDGYDYVDHTDGNTIKTETNSGLVGQVAAGQTPTTGLDPKDVRFVLQEIDNLGNVIATAGDKTFQTDVLSGANPFIFSAGPGSYILTVDGNVGTNKGAAALYDLQIAAVPLPAGVLLLGLGLGGLVLYRRRQTA